MPARHSAVFALALLLASLASSSLHQAALAQSLLDCLQATDTGVLTAADASYGVERLVPNRRINFHPAAIVFPNSTDSVRDVVLCARSFNVSAVARSGGHSYEGRYQFTACYRCAAAISRKTSVL